MSCNCTNLTGTCWPPTRYGYGLGINWMCEWSPTVQYWFKDAVQYNGDAYFCLTSNINQTPVVGAYWCLLASGGNQGTQGPQGPQGPANGPQGPQGNDGAAGPQGVQGDAGGPQGVPGAQGPQGVQGSQGNQGYAGSIGNQGAKGNQGYQGPQGNQGAQGARGYQGYQGNQGAKGNQGGIGAQGNVGSQGAQGYQGVSGLLFIDIRKDNDAHAQLIPSDAGKLVICTNVSPIDVSMPLVTNSYKLYSINCGANPMSLYPHPDDIIAGVDVNGSASFPLDAYESVSLVSDGANWFTFSYHP